MLIYARYIGLSLVKIHNWLKTAERNAQMDSSFASLGV